MDGDINIQTRAQQALKKRRGFLALISLFFLQKQGFGKGKRGLIAHRALLALNFEKGD
jgi:hypothetical protein